MEMAAASHVEQGAVAIQILRLRVMAMTIQAELQLRKLVDVIVEHLSHVVVKLL